MDSSSSAGTSTQDHFYRPAFQGIRFLKATSKDDKVAGESVSGCEPAGETILTEAGQEARTFYESVISSGSSSGSNVCASTAQQRKYGGRGFHAVRKTKSSVAKAKRRHSQSKDRSSGKDHVRNVHAFLRSAQEGDVKTLSSFLDNSTVDVNEVDSFNWTALMCASFSGQSDAVSLLLKRGALWESYQDRHGQSALDLAKVAGHMSIVRLLEGSIHPTDTTHQQHERRKDEKLWCDVCKVEFPESAKREHHSCTVHLFNCQHKPQSTMYYIPESNVGFQMMMKDGWNKETGLGPEGTGLKFPVKTVLKRDRKGLGAMDKEDETAKARVTHFRPFDIKAVKRPVQPKKMRNATLSKRARKKSERNKKNWEKDFRQSFNLDL